MSFCPSCAKRPRTVLSFKMMPPLTRFTLIKSGYANPAKNRTLNEALDAQQGELVVQRVVVWSSLAFYNWLFLFSKPNNKLKPILNLSLLNLYLSPGTFKMETLETTEDATEGLFLTWKGKEFQKGSCIVTEGIRKVFK